MLHEIKAFMEKNEYLSKLVPIIQNTGVMKYVAERQAARRLMDEARAQKKGIVDCYNSHTTEFKKLSEMLEDDFSRETLQTIIEYRMTLRWQLLRKIVVKPQYFVKDVLLPVEDEVFIDGGAYTGDTIRSLIAEFGGGLQLLQKNICLGTGCN